MDNQILTRVKQLRIMLNLTENALADRIGISQGTLNYQNNRNDYSYNIIYAIAKTFPNVSMEWLIRGEGDMFGVSDESQSEQELAQILRETMTVFSHYLQKKN